MQELNAFKAMMGLTSATPTGAIGSLLTDMAVAILSNPEAVDGFQRFFCSHHNAVDVAQDALDAYEHGEMTKSQALRIINIALEEEGVTVDVEKRQVLESLFNR